MLPGRPALVLVAVVQVLSSAHYWASLPLTLPAASPVSLPSLHIENTPAARTFIQKNTF